MKYHEEDVDIFNQSETPSKSSMKLLEERIDMVRNMMNERLGKVSKVWVKHVVSRARGATLTKCFTTATRNHLR